MRLRLVFLMLLSVVLMSATVTRSVKAPSGGTSWVTGDSISQTALEGDFSGIINQVNGNIDQTNLATNSVGADEIAAGAVSDSEVNAAAAIAVSKLSQLPGLLDADIVDDFSAALAESRTATDPGSSDSASLATNLEEELARIRYALKRAFIGAGTWRTSGADAAAWFDGNAIGPDLLVNGSFVDNSTTPAAPFGWALIGTPNAITPTSFAGLRPEGIGRYLLVVDAVGTGGAANEGIQQTLVGLKASTLYLVEARVRPNTDVVKLITTGAAAGTFDDLAIVSTSGGGAWETLSGLIWTDATPTNVVVQLLSNATDYSFGVSDVSLREVVSAAAAATNEHEGTNGRGGNLIRTVTDTTTGAMNGAATTTVETNTTLSVVVPGPGYQIEVSAETTIQFTAGAGDTATVRIAENIDSGGWATVASRQLTPASADIMPVHVTFLRGADATSAITPGSLYQYRISGTGNDAQEEWDTGGAAGDVHRLTVRLTRTGE